MAPSEYNHYQDITSFMEADFLVLGNTFMRYVEEIIFGDDTEDMRYYCYHLYNDNYTKNIFSKLSYRVERLLNKTDQKLYPNLFDGFSNLLIYLKEPIVRENDPEYKEENYQYWRKKVCLDLELTRSGSFVKYLM